MAFIIAGEEEGCLVAAGEDEVAFMRTQGLGLGTPSAGFSATHLFSNAKRADDLSGKGLCLGATVTPIAETFGGGAELCLGSKTTWTDKNAGWVDYTGIFSLTVGGALGVKPAPFVELHMIPGYTGVQTVCTNLVCSTAARILITAPALF